MLKDKKMSQDRSGNREQRAPDPTDVKNVWTLAAFALRESFRVFGRDLLMVGALAGFYFMFVWPEQQDRAAEEEAIKATAVELLKTSHAMERSIDELKTITLMMRNDR